MQDSLRQGRLQGRDHYWDGKRKPFAIAIAMAFVLLQILFLGDLSYLFGILHKEDTRYHNINIGLVDYDGGVVGRSVEMAYEALRADDFPTLQSSTVTTYPTEASLRQAVCQGKFWAAVYIHEGASSRLASALNSSSTTYNASDTVTYIWNEAHYPTIGEGVVVSSLETLFAVVPTVYYQLSGVSPGTMSSISTTTAVNALLEPIVATSVNLNPTTQGPRVFYNTIAIVMPIIQQFFFLMALNGITASFGLLSNLSIKGNGFLRAIAALAYTLIAAFSVSGYIWAFKEDWGVGGREYILTVLTYWLYMHINFVVLDIATSFISMSFTPYFVLTWAIMNVASTIIPFELSPGFYRWGYALPAHETYSILTQIWSHGCNNQLYRALPILFAWEIVGLAGAVIATRHRCAQAKKMSLSSDNAGDSVDTASTIDAEEKERRLDSVEAPTTLTLGATSTTSTSFQNPELREQSIEKRILGPSFPQPFVKQLSYTVPLYRAKTTT